MLSDSLIMKKMQRQLKQTAGYKQLVRELGLHGDERLELSGRLQKLVSSGQLVAVDSDRYAIPQAASGKNLIAGKLSLHRDGFGFVIPDLTSAAPNLKTRLSGDIFIPPHAVGPAMHGDRVLVEVTNIRNDGRAEGRIVRPLNRAHPTVVGIFHYGSRNNYVVPILGYEDYVGVDVEIIIRKYHLPHRFPDDVLRQAEEVEPIISSAEMRTRRDFRELPIVTIDGETARDFDDAVLVRRLGGGNFELQVHIADVAHYVQPDSPLDQEARLRGTSVYFPDRAVPMLPLELSTDICSLRPQVDRLVMSCLMEIDNRGEIAGYEICPGIIRSAERMTYTAVNAILEGDESHRKRYASLIENLELMRDLATILNRKR